MHAYSRHVSGVVHDVLETKSFPYFCWNTSRSGQVKEILDTLLPSREMAIVKTEADANRVKGNPPEDHFAR